MAKMALMLLLLLQATFFTVFSEELETLPPTSAPHTSPPTKSPSPVHPPAHPPHHHGGHHHHHHHSPAPAPAPVHTPSPPKHHHYPPPPAPVHTPSSPPKHHHYPPPPAPSPVHTPSSPPPHTTLPPKHHHYPPSPAPSPVKPPVHPPVVPVPVAHPPKRPIPTPTHIPRSFIAVQGVVFLKPCKYAGVDTLLGATPLLGAVVKLQCNNTKYKLVQKDVTDKNGYFFIEGPKNITTYGVHKCNVVLVTAPNGLKPSNLHGGLNGAVLRPEKPFVAKGLPFFLYTVGPLAFEPKCPH